MQNHITYMWPIVDWSEKTTTKCAYIYVIHQWQCFRVDLGSLSLAASSFECVLSMFWFSGRGMALSFLLLFSAALPLLSVSAYDTSAGNDSAVSYTVFVSDTMSPVVWTKCLWLQQYNGWACSLLVCCVFVLVNMWLYAHNNT